MTLDIDLKSIQEVRDLVSAAKQLKKLTVPLAKLKLTRL